MKTKKIPLRMCIVCKTMLPKSEMIRVVKSPLGEITVDTKGKLSGRGAYICSNPQCFEKCKKTKAINRNFKSDINSEIYVKLEDEYNRKK